MALMVGRNYALPHRVVCVTNDSAGIDKSIEIVRDREDFADVPSPHAGINPSCYRRLRMFGPDAVCDFGQRFVSLDLDEVLTGDLVPLWERPEDVVFWRDPLWPKQYNGSMALIRASSRPEVWSEFDPQRSPQHALAGGFKGSDQGWISYKLRREATWGREDGVYSYRFDKLDKGLPTNARVTVWHGRVKPWDSDLPWVLSNYR